MASQLRPINFLTGKNGSDQNRPSITLFS